MFPPVNMRTFRITPTKPAVDPVQAWNAAVDAKVATGMRRSEAILAVMKEQPTLRAAYSEAVNAQRASRRK